MSGVNASDNGIRNLHYGCTSNAKACMEMSNNQENIFSFQDNTAKSGLAQTGPSQTDSNILDLIVQVLQAIAQKLSNPGAGNLPSSASDISGSKSTAPTGESNSTSGLSATTNNTNTGNPATNTGNTSNIAQVASKYTGQNNANGQFSNGKHDPDGWCHHFANFAYKNATGQEPPWGYDSGPKQMYDWANKNGKLVQDPKQAKSGDLVLYDVNSNLEEQHVGIVKSIDPDGTLHTIEGNWNNQVTERTIKPSDEYYKHLSGFLSV